MNTLTLTPVIKMKLDRLSDKVKTLTYIGEDPTIFDKMPIVAIVGTRKPTPYGKMMTEKLAEELARAGVVIISGLALGIDGIAHTSAIKANGKTIAVIANGLDKPGPATNRLIAEKIINTKGSILSEHSAGYEPRPYDFVLRNRLVVALSDAVIIPEATIKSGSFSSAKYALDMKIPLYVVPGNTTSPMSTGTNYLLKNGARAITESSDVLKLLEIDQKDTQLTLDLTGDTPEETLILQKISLGITNAHEIQQTTKLSTADFQTASTMLEVQGRIGQNSLGIWHLK